MPDGDMNASDLWETLLSASRERIGHQNVEIWLRPGRAVRLDGQELVVRMPNRYYADWNKDNYAHVLSELSIDLNEGEALELSFVAEDEVEEVVAEPDAPAETPDPVALATPVDTLPRALGVNADQTFENYVVGGCNQFAHAAARAVAESPARTYNPLFIYGHTGLGKTHLMHAAANLILANHPQARVVYVTAEDFMNEMIKCLRFKRMDDFRAKYRKRATVLLVDDIQFLSGKDRTQEEFFHTFNALQNAGRQIVLTADVLPREIEKLEPRLRTRFEGGLMADLQAPDMETMQAILWQKADQKGLSLPSDLTQAIATRVQGNIRELEGVLNRLVALTNFYHQPLTLSFAEERLRDFFQPEPPKPTVTAIIDAVARFHNIRPADIIGSRRTRKLTRPRHIAMHMARVHTGLSYPELGKEFGGRDHSTIQHGCRRVGKELANDPDLSYQIGLIEQSLNLKSRT